DRKVKSAALEMRAVYGGKTDSVETEIALPVCKGKAKEISIVANERTGELLSVKADGKEVLKTPVRLNITRYIDNDMKLAYTWNGKGNLNGCKPHIFRCEKTGKGYVFEGVLAANCLRPVLAFTLSYTVEANTLTIGLEYQLNGCVRSVPRVGLEFGVAKAYADFAYVGYGPYESYVDKHLLCDYGYYESSAEQNYEKNYVRPQESGSHYQSRYLRLNGLCGVTAETPFSFSVNPYTTEQLRDTKHAYQLKENDFVNVCLDLAMRGVGSYSCGPQLDEEYEIPKQGKNTFTLVF
ncbi:MAG: hypothetical protein IJD33_01900, partial [Clostridia bacterium]|nr:hypothetical protein [Clostridia bacterium]